MQVLAQRTGHLDWNPQLAAKNEAIQLMDIEDSKVASTGGGPDGIGIGVGGLLEQADGVPMKTSEKAMDLVAEFGAQGAVLQVMQAAKDVLERELRDLDKGEDDEYEEAVEDPVKKGAVALCWPCIAAH